MNAELVSQSQKNITVWIVEDDSSFRKNMFKSLNRRKGLDCTRNFPSCVELFAKLKSDSAQPDVVLMDLGLPRINGIDGIRELAKIAPDVKVIVLTVFADKDKVFRAIDAGAAGYMLKHASLVEIEKGIRDVVDEGAILDSQIAKLILTNIRGDDTPALDMTQQELAILKLLADGDPVKLIAATLEISHHTVDFHLRNIYKKMGVHSQSAAVARAVRKGII